MRLKYQRTQCRAGPLRAPQRVISLRRPRLRLHASQPSSSSPSTASLISVRDEPLDLPATELVSVAEPTTIDPTMPKAPSVAFSSPVSHPSFFIMGLTVYSMVAMDVFYPDGLHLLQPLDQAIHQAVLENIDPALRRQLFGNVVSNVWSLASSVGWIFATATALSRRNPLAWQSCALGWALWIFGVGPIEHDPALMEALKDGFGRARPSPVHRTASFPSGHTACAVLLVGALLFVLLPVVYGSKPGKGGGGSGGVSRGDGEEGGAAAIASGGGGGGKRSHPIFDAIYSVQFSWGLWAASALTTIVGRVGVDAHWLSDTLAGAALSVALVSGLASATERLAGGAAGGGDEGRSALRGD